VRGGIRSRERFFFFLGKTKETISLVLSRWLEFWKAVVLAADFKKEIHAILWHLDSVLGGWLVVYLWGRGVRGRYSALSLMTVGVLMFWKWEYSEYVRWAQSCWAQQRKVLVVDWLHELSADISSLLGQAWICCHTSFTVFRLLETSKSRSQKYPPFDFIVKWFFFKLKEYN
jgi:hypothetical protein